MLLRKKFKFQNIRHAAFYIRLAAFEIRIAACEIQITIYASEAYYPKSELSFTISGATITATMKYLLNLQFYPKAL